MNQFYFDAIYAAYPNAVTVNSDSIVFDSANNVIEIDQNVISNKIAELEAAEPLRQLREQRNQLLAQTDWMAVSDRVMTQTQIDYRQALRDITTQTPSLDSNGQLTGITWPTPPND